jgi:STE24 endopeptidase
VNEDKATRYHRLKRLSGAAGVLAGLVLLAAFWLSGASAGLRTVAERAVDALGVPAAAADAAVVAAYVLALCLASETLALPLAWYRGFTLERRYGLSPQGFTRWLIDHVKASALATALAVGAAVTAYAAMAWSPRWWWVVTAAAFSSASVLLAFAAPVVLFPLFFRFRPLDRAQLVDRLSALAARVGAPVLGVYEWSLGERSRTANAALVGLGGTRRILVSDTLLAAYSDEEIEVILAHELAHHVHGDLWKALAVDAALTLGALGGVHLAFLWLPPMAGVRGPGDVAGLPVALLAAAGWSLVTLPLVNALSRAHERQADRFALDLTHKPEAFISAMKRLGMQNLADEQPSPLVEWLFHSHPPLPQRVAAARAWAAAETGEPSRQGAAQIG